MSCGMRVRIGMAVVAVGFLQGVAAADDVFTLEFTMTPGPAWVKTEINAPLQHGRPLRTGLNWWIIHVDRGGPEEENYRIVFGPDPSPTTSTEGQGFIRDAVHDSDHQELVVQDGVAYFFGPRPYGGSDGGSGVGEGTIFVVQGRPGGDEDRFIYLDTHGGSPKLVVHKHDDKNEKVEIPTVNRYVEVPDDDDVTGLPIKNLRNKETIRNMLWEVVKAADQADDRAARCSC